MLWLLYVINYRESCKDSVNELLIKKGMELNYRWKLAEAHFPKNRGKVFSCFSSFPLDYDFLSEKSSKVQYTLGMSVPPLMMAHLADRIYNEWQIIFNHQIRK